MKKAKKYVYPLICSVGFLIVLVALVFIINAAFEDGGYVGLAVGLLILLAWIVLGLPIYCIIYSKIIVDERLKFLFCAYNSLMIAVSHIMPFNWRGEETIIVLFTLWVLFWNIVPLFFRSLSRKCEEKILKMKLKFSMIEI